MTMYRLLILFICFAVTGCGLFHTRSKAGKTDVASVQKGGPSAEISISFFAAILQDEAGGKPAPPAWGSYEDYWKSRMQYIATHESKEYYERVFRDFDDARLRLGLRS